ncbi:PucR family transcriptional regulator [Streptomyces sp. YC504]|uniref:PucR family transcriptional regulator n=1 Tax=Streptomyces mesophilus TaxID=1775132 RepID=A0A6G4XG48_9ACTN|nr:helix-turn-helix domain-containing protein [Streptomyces mesophilus]NGO76519.1 PucR family transcriptional regulator [Streptomyces mesophilus]
MSGRAPLGRVLADLGSTFIVSTVGEPDPARPVGGVLIHDPHDAPARLPGAIVLGVGIYGADEVVGLVEWAAVLGAAAVIVRAPIAVDEAVQAAVDKAAIPVLGLMAGASWAQVAALLRSMLSVDELVGEPAEEPLAGDLFALANAISALLDGPVTVEDRDGRVLAFSSRQDEGDEARIATILDRQVPAEKLRALEERGAFRLLYRNDEPLYLEGIAAKPRVAIAVRAGGEILGSIWVVVKQPLTRDRERALSDAAKVAALHLLRRRAGEDVGHRLRADLLATLLEGGEGAPGAAARLGLSAQPACVLALAATHTSPAADRAAVTHTSPAADQVVAADRIAGALALHLNAIHPRTATATLGGVTYAVLPATSDEAARRVAESFLERIGDRASAVIGVGGVAGRPEDLRRSRAEADQALRVLRERRPDLRTARLAAVYVDALLLELADRIATDGGPPDNPIVRLRVYDAEHGTTLTETLAAWLDAFGDVISASAAMHVHPNTFRYRLKRLATVSGLDLSTPEARFEAMLHLRLAP